MCGITGWINFNYDISKKTSIIHKMTDTLKYRGPDSYGYYISSNALLGHRRLIVIDPSGGAQPMLKYKDKNKYAIVYNGELYNTEDIRNELKSLGYEFSSYSDTEVLLTSYIEWGSSCTEHLNGIFAFGIWDEYKNTLFLARDHLGVKPLFYTISDNSLIFGSELKAILAHPEIEPLIDENGIMEIFGLGPARTLGSSVFKNINEIKPGHCLSFSKDTLDIKKYWDVTAKEHTESEKDTIEHVRALIIDAVERQLYADVPVCTFLSGGLDSSAISAIAANYFKKNNLGILNTYSIDYYLNELYFKANEYQPNSDSEWAKLMVDFIGSNHNNVILQNTDLANALKDATLASDLPGMADIDSSLYLFCKEIKKNATVALSGECADEIFGGYPWYLREDLINSNTFPWSQYVNERIKIISPQYKKLPIEEYVQTKYNQTIASVPHLDNEDKFEKRIKEISYLNLKWFMITLLNRKDRMSMANSLEVRVPFADYRIVEYAYNIPSNIKLLNGREKGLLREALRGILPDGIIDRKKSPYPKTFNPSYTDTVKNIAFKIINNKNSPLLQLIDIDVVRNIIETGGKSYTKPWYGQLMTGPQLIAFLIQINTWMKKYNVKIC